MFPPAPHLILEDLPESWIFTRLVNSVIIFFSVKGIKKSFGKSHSRGISCEWTEQGGDSPEGVTPDSWVRQ